MNAIFRGGLGAKVYGEFHLEAGTVVNVAVGQSGSSIHSDSTSSNFGGAGGGGE